MKSSLIAGVFENVSIASRPTNCSRDARISPRRPVRRSGRDRSSRGTPTCRRSNRLARRRRKGRTSRRSLAEMAKSAARTIGSSVGRQLVRGVLGSMPGG
jgi:hypothetical protein